MKISRQTRRSLKRAKRSLLSAAGIVSAVISLVLLAWMTVNVHPGAAFADGQGISGVCANIPSDVENFADETRSYVLSDYTKKETKYVIAEDSLTAPVPDPRCYEETYTPRDVIEIIEDARDSGLLGEEEKTVFSLNSEFLPDTLVKTYRDDSILVICWKEMLEGRVCSFCEVKIADASQFRRKLSQDTYGSPVKAYATELASEVNAVAAMNADLYLQRDLGVTVYNRQVYRFNEWIYTGRYNQYNAVDTLLIDTDGNFNIMHMGEQRSREDAEKYVSDHDILFSIAFGPVLVENGELRQLDWYPLGEIQEEYSRAGIAQCGPLHYLYMTVSHSEKNTPRCTINEFAQLIHSKGVLHAYALDGGQTGELVFEGEPYNHIDFGAERTVSDIIYFATAIPYKGVDGK